MFPGAGRAKRSARNAVIAVKGVDGSTLLPKGLEADVAVALDANELSPKNLYEALTRSALRLVVCSRHAEPGRRSGG